MAERTDFYGALTRNRKAIEAKHQELLDKRREDGGLLGKYSEYLSDFDRINKPDVAALFEELDSARERLNTALSLATELDELRNLIEGIGDIDPVDVRTRLLTGKSAATTEWWDKTVTPRVRLSEVASALTAGKENALRAVEEKRAVVQSIIDEEQTAVQTSEAKLREKTQTRPEDELVAGQREQTKRRHDAAGSKKEQYEELFRQFEALMKARAELIRELEELQDKISGARAASRDTLIGRLSEFDVPELAISILVDAGADRSRCEYFMQEEGFLTRDDFGQYKRSQFATRCCAMACPTRIARAILDMSLDGLTAEGHALDGDGMLTGTEAASLLNAYNPYREDAGAQITVVDDRRLKAVFDLQEQPWDDEVRILLNDKPVDRLSPGQRSSAMLPLLALAEQVPLVIDQPEDNLDNRMVGRTLTKILAALKERRQIIVATHNPNIVVGGDAEQVIVLDTPESRKAVVLNTGSIDDGEIVKAVVSIMEGGKEAFEARKRLYATHVAALGD